MTDLDALERRLREAAGSVHILLSMDDCGRAADAIADLRAKLAEAENAKNAAMRLWGDCGNDLHHAESALAAAEGRASAAEKDAARYGWLCDASGQQWDALLGAQMTGELDAAIDAAIDAAGE